MEDRLAIAHPFIARKQSYHGNTLGAGGGDERRRRQFAPLLMGCYPRLRLPVSTRDRRADETQQQYTERLLNELEQIIPRPAMNDHRFLCRKPW